jgi:hypothetical protein
MSDKENRLQAKQKLAKKYSSLSRTVSSKPRRKKYLNKAAKFARAAETIGRE